MGGSLYLVGKRKDTEEYEKGAMCCQMCRKLIINSGIKEVFVRYSKAEYVKINVDEWVSSDDLLEGKTTY